MYEACVHATACVWKLEDNMQKLVLSFKWVGPRSRTEWSGLAAGIFLHRTFSLAWHAGLNDPYFVLELGDELSTTSFHSSL